ncbi:hypothetical protein LZ30DRAFT_708612 [Colletotrichum cereale]|nr:hypothetical protein LZ30DRAFT_708612 [Colletotrichum cereale]
MRMLVPTKSELVSDDVIASKVVNSGEAELVWAVDVAGSIREELLEIDEAPNDSEVFVSGAVVELLGVFD